MRFTNLSRRSFLTATAGAAALSPLAPLRRLAAAASANTLNLGLQLYSLRNYKVDEALKQRPRDAHLLGARVRFLRHLGRDAEARQAFQQGLRIYEQLGIAQEVAFAQALLASVVGA